MSALRRYISYLSVGAGSALIVKNAGGEYSFSGWIALGITLVVVTGLVIIVFRLTAKVDLVALVRAWRNPQSLEVKPETEPDQATIEGATSQETKSSVQYQKV